MDPITLSFAQVATPTSAEGQAVKAFADEVAAKSNGKITVEPYFTGSLLAGTELLNGISSGVADIGVMPVGYFPSELPTWNWFTEMGSLISDSYPHGMLQGAAATYEFATASAVLQQELKDHNLKLAATPIQFNNYDLICTKPIETRQQAQTARAQTAGQTLTAEMQSIGLEPIFLEPNEDYQAMMRGIVDCLFSGPPVYVPAGYWDGAKHYMPVDFITPPGNIYVMNMDTWNSLPREAQQILMDAFANFQTNTMNNTLDIYAKFAREGTEEHGIVFHDVSALNQIIHAHQESVINKLPSAAPESVKNAEKMLATYRDLLDHWMKIVVQDLGIKKNEKDTPGVYMKYGDLDLSKYNTMMKDLFAQQGAQ